MDYKVEFASSALRDIRGIVRYIATDNPSRATTFGELLISHTERLAMHPEMGRVVPEFGQSMLREIVVRSYRVIYRADHCSRKITVMRFWHGARGTPELHESA